MAGNDTLSQARNAKNDEFYTQLTDIEKELRHYREQFFGKTVLCNCDDPYESNFFRYFAMNFNHLRLKKLIATCYAGSPISNVQLSLFDDESPANKTTRRAHKLEITEVRDENGDGSTGLADVEYLLAHQKNALTKLDGDGDFRSPECVELLKEADIVVTNPPFSLFREYVAVLMEHEKHFLILGSQNAITYREIFRQVKENRLWLGYNNGGTKWFQVPHDYEIQTESRKRIEGGIKYFSMGNVNWFTNLDTTRRHENLTLYKKYSPEDNPHFDNYEAIEVPKVADIPLDWDGVMGVPITYIDKYNPEQFEIVGLIAGNIKGLAGIQSKIGKDGPYINGKLKYGRVLVRRIGETQ